MIRKTIISRVAVLIGLTATACTEDTSSSATEPTKEEAAEASAGAADAPVDYCARYEWYGDGECDTFCELPDPDCGGDAERCFDASEGDRAGCCELAAYPYCSGSGIEESDQCTGTSPLGTTFSDLDAYVVSRVTYDAADIDIIPHLHRRQIFEAAKASGFEFDGQDFDVVFDLVDDGRFRVAELNADGDELTWVSFDLSERSTGAIFRSASVTLVGKVTAGSVTACPGPDPVVELACSTWFDPNDTETLAEYVAGGANYSAGDTIPDTDAGQIFAAVRHLGLVVGDEDFDVAFEVVDDGLFVVMDVEIDERTLDWVSFSVGDTEVGVLFDDGTTRIVAEVNDSEVRACE